jgi:putative acetyltransferase
MPTQHHEWAAGHKRICRPAAAHVAKIMAKRARWSQSCLMRKGAILISSALEAGRHHYPAVSSPTPQPGERIAGRLAVSHILFMVTIREACPDDESALVDLWLRSVRATHTFLTEEDIQFFLPLVREALTSEQLEWWVLSSDANIVIGFMGLAGNSLEAMFLDPSHLRSGHGRRLVSHARALKGALTVDVNEQNPAARCFYEACGFVVVGRSELDSTGRPFPLLHMRQPT